MNDEIKYVKRSKYRTHVLKSLKGYPKMPSELAKETDIYQNHISNILKQLKDHDLVECINPDSRKGRLYRLTQKGKKIADNL